VDKEKTILRAGHRGVYNRAAESEAEYSAELTVSCSGICVFINESAWKQKLGDGYSEEKVQKLRVQLLRNKDVKKVDKALRYLELFAAISSGNQRQRLIRKVKRYLFDSPGINFNPSNFNAWKRLVSGKGTVDDARFIVHEIAEIIELERIQRETDFDFMGTDWETMSLGQKKQWQIKFENYYKKAHSLALEYEYDFIAKQVLNFTNGKISLSARVAAAIDPRRDEARLHMLVDGVYMEEHHDFEFWRQRASEMVDLSSKQLIKLRLHSSPTLEELVQAVKQQRLKYST
jgi:hypothetical protein